MNDRVESIEVERLTRIAEDSFYPTELNPSGCSTKKNWHDGPIDRNSFQFVLTGDLVFDQGSLDFLEVMMMVLLWIEADDFSSSDQFIPGEEDHVT